MSYQSKSIQSLQKLLQVDQDIKNALEISIQKAEQPDVTDISQFYDFLYKLLTHAPKDGEINPDLVKFYYLFSKAPGDLLKKSPEFNKWTKEFADEWGDYLNTTASAELLDTFINNPTYHIEDYDRGPSGWLTYNQFVVRNVLPGKRPVADILNNNLIVSTTDSVYLGEWPINEKSEVTTKETTWPVMQLLEGSPYAEKFKGGIFSHSYLDLNDYHRFHLPVGGIIREVRTVPGNVWINTIKKPDCTLEDIDDVGYQFTQTRGLIVIETETIGYVAVLAVGMGHVSSVTLTVSEGMNLLKGEEFGYFAFGGSDMIMLFEPDRIKFTAEVSKHYKQGEKIAEAI